MLGLKSIQEGVIPQRLALVAARYGSLTTPVNHAFERVAEDTYHITMTSTAARELWK
jgi:hypothetical protein